MPSLAVASRSEVGAADRVVGTTTAQSKARYTLRGTITDGTSGETLIGATIYDRHTKLGTTTNAYGFYSLTLPAGEVDLYIGYVGYGSREVRFRLAADTLLNLTLAQGNQLGEAVVQAMKKEVGFNTARLGSHELTQAELRNTPAVLGEPDVIKTLQMLPGVQGGTDGSAGLLVRGGGGDENLIMLDGTPLYHVDHMFGFFSVFTPEAVKKVTFHKSSFPARYSSRLSSVVDVRTNDGDLYKYHGAINVGLLSSRLHFEGPIWKGRTAFSLSGRRTYFDLIARPFMPEEEKVGYAFYDLNAKLNHRFNDRHRLFLSLYDGKDAMDSEYKSTYGYMGQNTEYRDGGEARWGNRVVALRWNYLITDQLFSNTTVAYNKYKFDILSFSDARGDQGNNTQGNFRSGIEDWGLRTDFDYMPAPRHHVRAGWAYTYHTFRPEVMTARSRDYNNGQLQRDTTYVLNQNPPISAHELSLYAEDDWALGQRWRLNYGVNFSLFHVNAHTYTSVQPRLALRYELARDWALKAGYTQMEQYVHLLTSMPIAMPNDLWVPVTDKIRPMRSQQFSAGAYFTGWAGWELSAEAYYKDMNHVLEYKDGVSFFGT